MTGTHWRNTSFALGIGLIALILAWVLQTSEHIHNQLDPLSISERDEDLLVRVGSQASSFKITFVGPAAKAINVYDLTTGSLTRVECRGGAMQRIPGIADHTYRFNVLSGSETTCSTNYPTSSPRVIGDADRNVTIDGGYFKFINGGDADHTGITIEMGGAVIKGIPATEWLSRGDRDRN
jgi:hypothetical protein